MRKPFGSVALVAFLGVSAPASAAPVPTRDCASRGEGPEPVTRLAEPDDMRFGPAAFRGLKALADPHEFRRHRSGRGRYLVKTPLMVGAGRSVTVSIARADRDVAGLNFVNDAPHAGGVAAVRFVACAEDEPSFAHAGGVGPVTAFPGGWALSRPACVRVVVRVPGRSAPYRRDVPFGVRRC
jgi:hypothetical protein